MLKKILACPFMDIKNNPKRKWEPSILFPYNLNKTGNHEISNTS